MLLLTVLISLFAGAVSADEIAPKEARFLLLWPERLAFLQQWQQDKAAFPEAPVAGLLKAHSKPADEGDYRVLKLPFREASSYTQDRINRLWFERALNAYRDQRLERSQRLLARMTNPLHPRLQARVWVLEGLIAQSRQNHAQALQWFDRLPATSPLQPLLDYNRGLSYRALGRPGQARQLLNEHLQGPSTASSVPSGLPPLQGHSALLRERMAMETEQRSPGTTSDAASQAEQRLEPSLLQALPASLEDRRLVTEASLYREINAGRPTIEALMRLVQAEESERLSLHHGWLLEALHQAQASAQAVALGSTWIRDLTRELRLEYQALDNLAQTPVDELIQVVRARAEEEASLPLSSGVERLMANLQRLDQLIQLLEATLDDLPRQNALFARGRPYIASRIKSYPGLEPHPPYRLPETVSRLSPEERQLELKLTRLVGTPEPWEERYRQLDGLALWHEGQKFPHPWWKRSVILSEAEDALERQANHRRALVERLNGQATEDRLKRLEARPARARTMLQQLRESREKVTMALAQALVHEPARGSLKSEQTLLWLSAQAVPELEQYSSATAQNHFELVDREGSLRLVSEPREPQLPDLSAPLDAFRLLAEEARNPAIALQAKRQLADLSLLLAESATIEGRSDEYPGVSLDKALARYRALLEAPEPQVRQDQILYQMARAQALLGQSAETLATLETLQRRFPQSPFRHEVLFRIGELRFTLEDFDLAADAYRQLLASGQPEYADRARYKLAWSRFKLGQHQRALDHFFPLLDQYWSDRDREDGRTQRLLDDVLRVIAMTFSYQQGLDSLNAYLEKLGTPPYAEAVYQSLGHYYERKNRRSDAADVFSALVRRNPQGERAPFYQSRVIAAYESGGFSRQAWPEREAFVRRFGPESPYWLQAEESTRDRIRPFLQDYLDQLATRAHARAQQADEAEESRRLLNQAVGLYDQYLQALPADGQRLNMVFLKAEALTELGHHQEAASTYNLAAYGEGTFERRSEAGYAALLAYQNLHEQASGAAQRRRWLEKGIEQSQRFIERFPEAPQAPQVATKRVEDFLLGEDYARVQEEAADLLDQNRITSPALRLRLWRARAHASFALAAYAAAESAYLKGLELPMEAEERQLFRARTAEAIYKQGESARDRDQRPDTAIGHFLRLGRVIPEAEIRPVAEFDAAALLLENERWAPAIEVLEAFRSRYPDHALSETIPDKLVLAYESTQQWDQAAFYLQQIQQREGDSPLGREALWRAAQLQEKAGNPAKAASLYGDYAQRYPEPLDEAMEARQRLVEIADRLERPSQADRWLADMVQAVSQAQTPDDRSLMLASDAALRLGRDQMEAFEAVRLDLPLKASLARKRSRMEAAAGHLNQVVDFGLAKPATRAILLLGDLYRHLSQALMDSARPQDLDELAAMQYEILLEEQALPFEDRAISLYEQNLKRIGEGLYTPAVEESMARLKVLMPARYDKPEQVPAYVPAID